MSYKLNVILIYFRVSINHSYYTVILFLIHNAILNDQ